MGSASSPIGKLFGTMDKIDPTAKVGTKIGIAAPGNLLFPAAPKMPGMPTPATMPDPNDPALALAKKRKIADASSRSGRQSTILSDTTDSLGA